LYASRNLNDNGVSMDRTWCKFEFDRVKEAVDHCEKMVNLSREQVFGEAIYVSGAKFMLSWSEQYYAPRLYENNRVEEIECKYCNVEGELVIIRQHSRMEQVTCPYCGGSRRTKKSISDGEYKVNAYTVRAVKRYEKNKFRVAFENTIDGAPSLCVDSDGLPRMVSVFGIHIYETSKEAQEEVDRLNKNNSKEAGKCK